MNGETLNALCANHRSYPLPGTFLGWLDQEPEYNLRYRKAKAIQAELLVDGMLEDGKAGTWDAGVRVRAGQIYAEKTDPGRYGPRATIITPPSEPEVVPNDAAFTLRRKLNAMAERTKAKAEEEKVKPNGHDKEMDS